MSQFTYQERNSEPNEPDDTRDVTINYNENPMHKELHEFLCSISLGRLTKVFVSNGFDDLSLMIEQMSKHSKDPITDQNLKEIGVKLPGHRARILVKLEETAKAFDFDLPTGLYYNLSPDFASTTEALYDPHVKYIENCLSQLKMNNFLSGFQKAGYCCLELMLIQMVSKNPITDKILEKDVKIDKIGYRVRILNKLKQGKFLF